MRTIAVILVLSVCLTLPANGQSTIPPYHAHNDFLLASPGTLKTGLFGFDNPALLTYQHQPDIAFMFSDANGKWSDFKRWGLFTAFPHFGFGLIHEKSPVGLITDYRISLALGDRALSTGLAYGWSTGSKAQFNRYNLTTVSFLIRPMQYVSVGLIGTKAFGSGDAEGVVEIAGRPLGNEIVTAFADYAIQSKQSLNNGAWSAGVAVEALPGIRVTGRYFDTKAFTVGVQLSLGSVGLTTQAHYDQNQKYAYNTYGIRLGSYDRNIIDTYLRKNQNYVEMNLLGPIKYQKFRFFDDSKTLANLLESIDAAKSDVAVAGIAINTSGMTTDREKLWELREKLKEFKTTGKRVVIFIDRGGIDVYHFASIADKIVMDPVGTFALEGYVMGRTFLKGTLEKIGIGYDEWRFFKYKSAVENFSRDKMSDADREQR
ncbi:MAG: S49 family peptidase, partial [Bacteroidota bacterium]